MSPSSLDDLFKSFHDLKVMVIGDVMVDAYLWGKVDRISPEAPVPVISVTKREDRIGGAANVALNVAAMGAQPIVCAIAGNDTKGKVLSELLEKRGLSSEGIVHLDDRPTTVKSRVISGHQHIVRVDEESTRMLSASEENAFITSTSELIEKAKPDVFIFEDYNKGLLTENVISQIIKLSSNEGIPTAVDPKKVNFFSYKGVTLFKPNLKELKEGLKVDFDKKDQKALRSRPHGPLRVLSSVKTRSKALQTQLHTKQLLYNQQEDHDKANGISDPDGNPDSEPECKSLTKKDTDKPRQFSG